MKTTTTSSRSVLSASASRSSFQKDALLGSLRILFGWLGAVLYAVHQTLIIYLFAPNTGHISLQPSATNPRGRIAIVGAGITGISSAAHFLAHGFEVIIFEQSSSIGGIWCRANRETWLDQTPQAFNCTRACTGSIPQSLFQTSLGSEKLSPYISLFYTTRCQVKGVILSELQKIWNDHRLSSRTRFNVSGASHDFTVTHVTCQQDSKEKRSKWTINDGAGGVFDGLVVAVGTCGQAQKINFAGRDSFQGKMIHSTQLDDVDWHGKRVVVIGGGPSAVEAVELAVHSGCATPAMMVTRTDKWIVPRTVISSALLRLKPNGRRWLLDYITESAIRAYHYGPDLQWMSPTTYNGRPADRLYSRAPVTNDELLKLVRESRAEYVRAKINRITPHGVEIQRFGSDKPEMVAADVIVEVRESKAAGYKRPHLGFLPSQQLFRGPQAPDQYAPPNLFLQSFSPNNWSCLMTNCGYSDGFATVGHFHIGILARMMMMFMLDEKTAPSSRPISAEMHGWVDGIIQTEGPFSFFTYGEQCIRFVRFLLSTPQRRAWFPFVTFGWAGPEG
ncbi:uncharacterized protein VP01_1083g2 [Puccinia sorghi]|uniref:FAD/NAD(P)-binding domain-containing protein n=1 Tax=Puccinia sorghi TaxID=27349 RepID=A0A0L6VTA4_9BASI|nr:uncharacterized protein VP01_1083g2 [Puccinia sorghi]